MRLSEYTDHTLRGLMYCARNRQRLVTTTEPSEQYGFSKGHPMKVVNDLARQGLIETTRGRGGGLRQSKQPAGIRIGDVVRACESDFRPVECFDAGTDGGTLTPGGRMKRLFDSALSGFLQAPGGATLADLGAAPVDAANPPPRAATRAGAAVSMTLPFPTRSARQPWAAARG